MYRISNFNAPMASNPANGINNIALGGEESKGITRKDLKKLIIDVKSCDDSDRQAICDRISEISDNVNDKRLRARLNKLSSALMMANDPKKRTKDPDTGKYDPTYIDIAHKIEEEYLSTKEKSKVYNFREAQITKKKKKTRGNPFRVLMGKVGKLLDHGIEKNDIVRYLGKLKFWNKETIERAVDIVRDYNKKKKSKEDDSSEKNVRKSVSTDSLVNDAKEVADGKAELSDAIKEIKEIDKRSTQASLDYDKKPDYSKRSTPELIMRACFLIDLQDYDKNTPQGDRKDAADKKGIKQEIKFIKQALIARNFDKEDLKNLGLGD
jgi:hypothetical protein